jgi:2-haloacid dehalogenase
MNSFDAVVFDLGGVLIDWNPRHLYRKIFKDADEAEKFLKEVCTQEWNELHDAGADYEDTIPALVERYPHFKSQIWAYHQRWSEMLGEPIVGTVEILKRLHKQSKYRLIALTNCPADKYTHEIEKYPFLSLFDGVIVSGQVKMKKPDPRIFDLLISQFALNPQKTIFIDDSLKNIEVAKSLRIDGIHFKQSDGLNIELKQRQILVD